RLQDSFGKNPDIVHFISISVDPEHDSVENLRKFADKYKANHDTWWFVTGDKKEIYDFAIQEMKASIADPGVDTAFIHTEDFFLLDSSRVIRGWYNGFDSTEQNQLVRDIPTLMLEKDRSKPSILNRFVPVLPLIFFGIGVVIIVMLFMQRRKQKS
ncbi:MAG TPA: SCO family protein, partial [Chitinophagaceae bacterium]|nr:SCO family protein [Chitinophagaceae bacterium]